MDRLTALRAFTHLASGATFAETADRLRVRQPTISKWLAALEAEVGAQLIERTTRARRVTPAGRRFEDHARAILSRYDAAVAEIADTGGGLRGRLRVSLPVVFGERFLLPLVSGFLATHPALEAELRFSDAYVDLVGDGVDVAFRVGRPLDSSLKARTLVRTRRCVVAAPDLAARLDLSHPADLAQAPCLVHAGRIARDVWIFDTVDGPLRAPVSGSIVADNSAALLALARAGLGVALLAEWLVAADLAAGRLVELLTAQAAEPAPVQALTPPRSHRHPAAQALIAHVAAHLPAALPRAPTG